MYHTILGHGRFCNGLQTFFKQHDGTVSSLRLCMLSCHCLRCVNSVFGYAPGVAVPAGQPVTSFLCFPTTSCLLPQQYHSISFCRTTA
jgi:hypothetical protein